MVLEDFTQVMIYFLRSNVLLPEGNKFLVLLSALVLTVRKLQNEAKVFISLQICPNLNDFSCNDTKLTAKSVMALKHLCDDSDLWKFCIAVMFMSRLLQR